jgi:hypothetical protein
VWKGLCNQISLISHTRSIGDKWNILPLDLNCNFRFKAWKILTLLALKQPSFVIKKIVINKVKLLTFNPKIKCCGHVAPILLNVTMHIYPTCITHGDNLIINKGYKIGIWIFFGPFSFHYLCIMTFPNQPYQTNFFGNKSKLQEFKQKLEIFKICRCHIFNHDVKNNDKLNMCQFFLYYMTKNKLLKDSSWRQLNISNFIFCMPIFWIHKPLTIWNLPFTCMFFYRTLVGQ